MSGKLMSTKEKSSKKSFLKNLMHRVVDDYGHFVVLFVVILWVIIIAAVSCPKVYNNPDNEKNSVFPEKWHCTIDGTDFGLIQLPDDKKVDADSTVVLQNRIPQKVIPGATMLLRTSQQNLMVFMDKSLIYNSVTENGMHSSAYHFVRLPSDCEGKEIAVVLSSPYTNYSGMFNQIFIGSKASNVFYLIKENGFQFIIGLLILAMGLLLLAMFLFTKIKKHKMKNVCLGVFLMSAGYWVMVESEMLQFLVPYPMFIVNSSILAFSLLPVFLSLYHYDTHSRVLKNWAIYINSFMSIASLVLFIVTCVHPALPIFALNYYIVFVSLYALFVFAIIIMESIKSKKFFSPSVWGVVALGGCGLIEFFLYMQGVNGNINSNVLTIGILVFCVTMVVESLREFNKA